MSGMTTKAGTFLPFLKLKGKDYLQVMHRLVWFREVFPDGKILTEFVKMDDAYAVARAAVYSKENNILAIAHKREDKSHFMDYMEKAESGAVGRALAMCGFGSQFSPDLDEGSRIVDAPADREAAENKTSVTSTPMDVVTGASNGSTDTPTVKRGFRRPEPLTKEGDSDGLA